VDVTVTTYAGTSPVGSGDHYTYNAAAAPAVNSLATTSGPTAGGTLVTLTGTNFTGASLVQFGNVAAAFTINSDTSISAYAPPQAFGTVHVTVTTPTGKSATGSGDQFTYSAGSGPIVRRLSSTSGSAAGGTSLVIVGTGFSGASAVQFGNVSVPYTINSDSSISVTSPPLPALTVDVTVTTPDGTSGLVDVDQFTATAVQVGWFLA
jgi:hypothetical protein